MHFFIILHLMENLISSSFKFQTYLLIQEGVCFPLAMSLGEGNQTLPPVLCERPCKNLFGACSYLFGCVGYIFDRGGGCFSRRSLKTGPVSAANTTFGKQIEYPILNSHVRRTLIVLLMLLKMQKEYRRFNFVFHNDKIISEHIQMSVASNIMDI